MDTTALQATTFGFLAKMNHKSLEETSHFSCVECNWSHRRSTHTLLLPIFHPLKLVQVLSKHQLWKFKACFYSTQVFVALLLAPPLGSSPALTSHSTRIWKWGNTICTLLHNLLISFFTCIHAEPNPPTNLSATMTCGSQGYQVYIEWKVYHTDSKSTTVNIHNKYAHDKISSAGSSSCLASCPTSCPTLFSAEWVSPPFPHWWYKECHPPSTEHYILHAGQCHWVCL